MIFECKAGAATITPPPGLDELEAHILKFGAPAAFRASKPGVPELIAYTRALETEVARLQAFLNEECFY